MKMNNLGRNIILYSIALGSFIVIFLFEPLCQDQRYHIFADQRSLFDIPNFFDVTTNIFFAFIGFLGMYFTIKNKQSFAKWAWPIFFFGIFTLFLSSGYYHWIPNDETLVWDRLSLALIFASMVIALLSEFLSAKIERFFLIPAILFGICSVIYWYVFDDLRFYFWVQLAPMITIPVLLILYPSRYSHKMYLLMTLIFYILAKIVEIYDHEIYVLNNKLLSGHSLKHIFAAIGVLYMLQMIKKRNLKSPADIHEKNEVGCL